MKSVASENSFDEAFPSEVINNMSTILVDSSNVEKYIMSEISRERLLSLDFLCTKFRNSESAPFLNDLFISKLPQLLNEKNIIVFQEICNTLISFLRQETINGTIINIIISHFASNSISKKIEEKFKTILNLCLTYEWDIVVHVMIKRLDVNLPASMLLNALVCAQFIPQCIDFEFSYNILNIVRVLIKLISNSNPKISKQALLCFKKYLFLFTDDFQDFKKHLLVGIKDSMVDDLRRRYEGEKSPFARQVLDLIEHEQEPGSNLVQTSNVNEHRSQREEQRQVKSGKSRTLSNFTSQKPTTEFSIPDKFSEIPNLKSVDQKRLIIFSLVDSLRNTGDYSTVIPNSVFTILSHELEESNILLYSVIIELLELLLRKSTGKLNMTSAQARVLVTCILTKYAVKPHINKMILSFLDLTVSRSYMKGEPFLKNIISEISNGSNKNSRKGALDWLCKNSLFLMANGHFDDLVKHLKSKSGYKVDLEIYTKSFGGLASLVGEEVLMYVFVKLASQFGKEVNSKMGSFHKEVISELSASIQEFRSSHSKFLKKEMDKVLVSANYKLKVVIEEISSGDIDFFRIQGEQILKGLSEVFESDLEISKAQAAVVLNFLDHILTIDFYKNKYMFTLMFFVLKKINKKFISENFFSKLFAEAIGVMSPDYIVNKIIFICKNQDNIVGIFETLGRVLNVSIANECKTIDQANMINLLRKLKDYEKISGLSSHKLIEVATSYLSRESNTFAEKSVPVVTNVKEMKSVNELPPIKIIAKSAADIGDVSNKDNFTSKETLPLILKLPKMEKEETVEQVSKVVTRDSLLKELNQIASIDLLKRFITQSTNNYKTMVVIIDQYTYKELLTSLKALTDVILVSKTNVESNLIEFCVFLISIIRKDEKKKLFPHLMIKLMNENVFPIKLIEILIKSTPDTFETVYFTFTIIRNDLSSDSLSNYLRCIYKFFVDAFNEFEHEAKIGQFQKLAVVTDRILELIENSQSSKFPKNSILMKLRDSVKLIKESLKNAVENEFIDLANLRFLNMYLFENANSPSHFLENPQSESLAFEEKFTSCKSIQVIDERSNEFDEGLDTSNLINCDNEDAFKDNDSPHAQDIAVYNSNVTKSSFNGHTHGDIKQLEGVPESSMEVEDCGISDHKEVSGVQFRPRMDRSLISDNIKEISDYSSEHMSNNKYFQNFTEAKLSKSKNNLIDSQIDPIVERIKVNDVESISKINSTDIAPRSKQASVFTNSRPISVVNDAQKHDVDIDDKSFFKLKTRPVEVSPSQSSVKSNASSSHVKRPLKINRNMSPGYNKEVEGDKSRANSYKTMREMHKIKMLSHENESANAFKNINGSQILFKSKCSIDDDNNLDQHLEEVKRDSLENKVTPVNETPTDITKELTFSNFRNRKPQSTFLLSSANIISSVSNIKLDRKAIKVESNTQTNFWERTDFSSISTQTDLNEYESVRRLEAQIQFLKRNNEQITKQLYESNLRLDVISEERDFLNQKLKFSNEATLVKSEEGHKIMEVSLNGQHLAQRLLFDEEFSKGIYIGLLSTFEDADDVNREKFAFDMKFYIIDRGVVKYIDQRRFTDLFIFVSKLCIYQSLIETDNEGVLRILHKIMDTMLRSQNESNMMVVILAALAIQTSELIDGSRDSLHILHFKLLFKCLEKLTSAFKEKQHNTEILNRILYTYAMLLKKLCSVTELEESTSNVMMNLVVFLKEILRIINGLSGSIVEGFVRSLVQFEPEHPIVQLYDNIN